MKSPITCLIILLLLAACGPTEQSSHHQASPSLKTTQPKNTHQVIPQLLPITTTSTGELQPITKVQLSAEITGKIVNRPVEVGDHVDRNQLLIQIDPKALQIKKQALQHKLALQKIQLAKTTQEWQRQKSMGTSTTIQQIENLEWDYLAAEKQVAITQSELAEIQLQLNKTQIRAPFAGQISALHLKAQEFTTPGTPLATLINTQKCKLIVALKESYLAKLAENDKVVVERVYGGQSYQGRIFRIHPEAQAGTKKFPIEIHLANPNEQLRSGMFCQAKFTLSQQKQILLPLTFVQVAYQIPFVQVSDKQEGPFHKRQVQATLWQEQWLIEEGLEAGEWVQEF